MAERLASFLHQDLGTGLRAGLVADPPINPAGARWVVRAALVLAVIGVLLQVTGGYHAGFFAINGWARAYPGWLWQWLTMLGDERLAFALTLFFSRRHPRVFWALVCAALIGMAYARGLKPLIDAARPPGVLDSGVFQLIGPGHKRESFPSGHSVTAGVFFGVLIYYARWVEWRLFFLLIALLAGLSRVAVGVHWPVDVCAGLSGGLLAAWMGAGLARRWRWGLINASVHWAMVILAAIMALVLAIEGHGYPDAIWASRLVVIAALMTASSLYVVLPLRRYLMARD